MVSLLDSLLNSGARELGNGLLQRAGYILGKMQNFRKLGIFLRPELYGLGYCRVPETTLPTSYPERVQ